MQEITHLPNGPSFIGITRRPLWGPLFNWVPAFGPEAMMSTPVGRLVVFVISSGFVQEEPPFLLWIMKLRMHFSSSQP